MITLTVLSFALLSVVGLAPLGALAQKDDIPNGLNPLSHFCRRSGSATLVQDGLLLIDGGYHTFWNGTDEDTGKASEITLGINEFTIWYRLVKQDWDWDTNVMKIDPTLDITAKFGRNTAANTHPPESVRGALYPGIKPGMMFMWGGTTSTLNRTFQWAQQPPAESEYSLWEKDIFKDVWLQHSIKDQNENTLQRLAAGASAAVPDQKIAFHFNGLRDPGTSMSDTLTMLSTDSQFHSGMIMLDLQNRTATNMSTEAVSPRARAGGQMVYIPSIGTKGILVLIGGGEKEVNTINSDVTGDLVSMSTVQIFDVGSVYNPATPNGTWYNQTTTGDIPLGRTEHCLSVGAAPDRSSYNIYMFGGWDGKRSNDEVYILSLPSFKWFKASATSDPRFRHTCHMVTPRQMLVSGGQKSLNLKADGCDAWNNSISIFDPTSLQWTDKYEAFPGKGYEVPDLVIKGIGGSGKGDATQTIPATGWSSEDLSRVFDGKPPLAATIRSANNSSRAGLIAGIIIAIIAAIVLAIVGWWFFKRRRAMMKRQQEADYYVTRSHANFHVHEVERNMPRRPLAVALKSERGSWIFQRQPDYTPEPQPSPYIAELPGDTTLEPMKKGVESLYNKGRMGHSTQSSMSN